MACSKVQVTLQMRDRDFLHSDRQSRVHEHNILSLVLTFLPYASTPLFTSLLSILPAANRMPPALKFLHPYVSTLSNPPRPVIVYAASHGRHFYTALNAYVLDCCRRGCQYSSMVSQWASINLEATARMLDDAGRNRGQNRASSQEDIVLLTLPILDQGLAKSSPQDLRTSCFMLLAVLIHKAELGEALLDSLMQLVAKNWKRGERLGLSALILLASKKQNFGLPQQVFEVLIKVPEIAMELEKIQCQVPCDRLAVCLFLGVINDHGLLQRLDTQQMLRKMLFSKILSESALIRIAEHFFSKECKASRVPSSRESFLSIFRDYLKANEFSPEGRASLIDHGIDGSFEGTLQSPMTTRSLEISQPDQSDEGSAIKSGISLREDDLELAFADPSFQSTDTETFLSEPVRSVFGNLMEKFSKVSNSRESRARFSQLPVLQKGSAFENKTFFSFFIRVWCGPYNATLRVCALEVVQDMVRDHRRTIDAQVVFPFLVHGLSDPSAKVRRATCDLVSALAETRLQLDSHVASIGGRDLYGSSREYSKEEPLSNSNGVLLLERFLVPYLEEAQLDRDAIIRAVITILNGSSKVHTNGGSSAKISSGLRGSVISLLCTQITSISLMAVRVTLLKLISGLRKISQDSKTEVLRSLLAFTINDEGEAGVISTCKEQALEPQAYLGSVLTMLGPRDGGLIEVLLQNLDATNRHTSPLFYAAAANRIQHIWPSASDSIHQSLTAYTLNHAVGHSEDNRTSNDQSKVLLDLRSLTLTASTIRHLLSDVPRLSSRAQHTPQASKRRKTTHKQHVQARSPPTKELEHLTLVLECLDVSDSAKDPVFLPDVFQIVDDLQDYAKMDSASVAYLLNVALRVALKISTTLEGSPNHDFDRSSIHIHNLVDCIQTATSTQVQQAALLLVSSLSSVAPDIVLHGVMPVLTFMGSGFVRNDDEYSIHVVNKTIDSVVPRLVQSLTNGKRDPISQISQLILSFIPIYEHIPPYRRLGIFASIAAKIGVQQYLHVLLTVLIDKYSNDDGVYKFASELIGLQSLQVQVGVVQKILDVAEDLHKPKPTFSKQLLFDTSSKAMGSHLLRLVIIILEKQSFTKSMAESLLEHGADADTLQRAYRHTIQQALIIRKLVAKDDPSRLLIERIFGSIHNLLPLSEYAKGLPRLLQDTENDLRQQLLTSFERRLKAEPDKSLDAAHASLGLLPIFGDLISQPGLPGMRNAAVSCVDHIVDTFGKRDEAAVLAVARPIADILNQTNGELLPTTLLCLATCMATIGEGFIPLLQLSTARALELLAVSIAEQALDTTLHNAAFSFMTSVLLYIPFMISQNHLEQLMQAAHESANADMGSSPSKVRRSCLDLVAKRLDLPQCLQCLDRTWSSAIVAGPTAVMEHLSVLRQAIDRHKKLVICKQVEQIGALFLNLFDLRQRQFAPRADNSYDDADVDRVEDVVNSCLIAVIYKLNDNLFRPLFSTFISWPDASNADDAAILRRITLYKFLHKFFDTLKSIVTSYSSIILPSTISVLAGLSQSRELGPDAQLLWQCIFETLDSCFTHDQDELFLSLAAPPAPHASAAPLEAPPTKTATEPFLATTLISSLPHLVTTLPPTYTNLYVRTLTSYATATDSSPPHQRHLNLSLLSFLRASNAYALKSLSDKEAAKVRVIAVKVQRSITEKLGESWLGPMLSEILPVMREALDDDDETVADEVERWKYEIGEITGEDVGALLI